MNRVLRTFAIAAPLVLLPGLSAQSPKLLNEIKFVRGLVTELKFIDMAQLEVQALKKTYQDSDDFKLVAQLDIEVALEGAKRHPDRDTRRGLYKTALEQSEKFIERYSSDEVAMQARTTLADACIEFGSFLNEELEIARDESPDKVKELEDEAGEVFKKGVASALTCQNAFMEKGRKIDGFVAWMRRGILLREHGRAVPTDRKYLTNEANDVFEELILEVGEETILGQKAFFEMSKVQEVVGDLDGAISSYNDVVDAIYEALSNEEINLPESAQRLMFGMMQEVLDRKASICLKQGRADDVIAAVKLADERIKEFQAEGHPQFYDSLLLAKCQVQANSGVQGDVSAALKEAKAINKRHPNDYVGIKAKNLIAKIMSKSASLVTGSLLLEVAIGDYQLRKYDAASAGFKRALNGMDAADKKKLGFDAWEKIGRCNQNMQRHLEAALAFSRALEDHGADLQEAESSDNETKLKRIANLAGSMIARARASAGGDPTFDALKNKIEGQIRLYNKDIATAKDYNDGLRAKTGKKYKDAIAAFGRVQTNFPKYELALGHQIECYFRNKQLAEATQAIAKLRAYVANTELAEDMREQRGYRPQALAWAHYTEGRILYEGARGKDGTPDLTKFNTVEKHFLEFEANHAKNARSQMVKVHEILGHAYLLLGQDDKAIARYNKLKDLGATLADAHKFLGIKLFTTYTDRVKALETEADRLVKAKKDASATSRKLRDTRQKALNMGMDYAKTIGRPSYGILYSTMRLAERLDEWEKCEKSAEKILKLYPNAKNKSFRQVKPVLGYALLRQSGRMQEALDILNKAEKELAGAAGDKKTVAYYNVRRYKALALGGWPAFDKNQINYTPNKGLGKPSEAYSIMWGREYKKFATNSRRTPKYTLEWYKYYLEVYYFAMQARRIDDKFKARAETLKRIAASTDDFAALKAYGPEGARVHNLFGQIK